MAGVGRLMGSDEAYDSSYFEGETVSEAKLNYIGFMLSEVRSLCESRAHGEAAEYWNGVLEKCRSAVGQLEADAERWRECKPVIRRLATAFEKWQRSDAVMPSDGMLDAISDLMDLAKQEGK